MNITGTGFDFSAAGTCCSVGNSFATGNGYGYIGNGTNVTFYNNFANCNGTDFDTNSASSAISGKLDSKIDSLKNLVSVDFNGTFTALAAGFSCGPTPLTLTSAGTTISTPGTYCLTNNVQLSAASSINITGNNILLDLGGHTISFASTGTAIVCTGSRVTIQNVQINTCTNGILVSGSTQVIMQDLKIYNCTTSAITCLNTTVATIKNCYVSNAGLFGLQMALRAVLLVDNCQVVNNSGQGIYVDGTQFLVGGAGVTIRNTISSFNTVGFTLNNCATALLDNCNAANNTSHGYLVSSANINSQSPIIRNCNAEANLGVGFRMQDNGNTSMRYLVQGCSAIAGNNDGFQLARINGLVKDCLAQSNNGNGFLITGTMVTVQNCTAQVHQVANRAGFNLANAGTTCTITGCVATNNTIGFATESPLVTSPVFYLNSAANNGTNFSAPLGATSAAIALMSGTPNYGNNLRSSNP